MIYIVALICVLGIAAGQLLFKLSAMAFHRSGDFLNPGALTYFVIALALYGITTLGWVWLLQKAELGKIYPLMALAFVIVPIASYFMFGERFNAQYFLGVALIMVGIVISSST